MTTKVGSTALTGIKVGTAAAIKIMAGTDLVHSSSVPPVYRSESVPYYQTSTTEIDIAPPSGHVSGDLLIAWVAAGNPGTLALAVAGGQSWTQIVNTTFIKVWWAIDNGSLVDVKMTQTNSQLITAGMLCITKLTFNLSTPFDVTTGVLPMAVDDDAVVPAITTVTTDALSLLIGYWLASNSGNPYYSGQPSGFTLEYVDSDTGPNTHTTYVGRKARPIAGLTSGENFTNGNANVALVHMAIRPA